MYSSPGLRAEAVPIFPHDTNCRFRNQIVPAAKSKVTASYFLILFAQNTCTYSLGFFYFFLPPWIQLGHEMPPTVKLWARAGQVTLWEIAFGQSSVKSPSPAHPSADSECEENKSLSLPSDCKTKRLRKVLLPRFFFFFRFLLRVCMHFFFKCVPLQADMCDAFMYAAVGVFPSLTACPRLDLSSQTASPSHQSEQMRSPLGFSCL